MRIALIPLDSRPPSWQFPLRIAQIAGDELLSPPREMLGTLHKGAHQRGLLEWFIGETKDIDAAVVSWDALIYGGLVQSRAEGNPLAISELADALSGVDWQKCRGYLWLTVPRLGMTIASQQDWELHKLIAEYFRVWGAASADSANAKLATQLKQLEDQLGQELISHAWWLRRRNADYARDALKLAASLGFRTCHVAVEDNARTGPHLDEVAELRKLSLQLTADCRREGREPPRFSFFDGTDECGSLLTARAILDARNAPPLPVRLTLFPSSPTPDKYFGLYESHSLEDGLQFLAKFLGFEYRAEGQVQWLVCFGKQPQPDVFAEDPEKVFNNPLLLPEKIEGDEPLFVADLQACNGGNPHLLLRVGQLSSGRILGLSAWNTNFNALGYSAATMAIVISTGCHQLAKELRTRESTREEREPLAASYVEFVYRIADDYVYQSIIRPLALGYCRDKGWNPLDLSTTQSAQLRKWATQASYRKGYIKLIPYFQATGLDPMAFHYSYEFPWQRIFEVELV